MAPFWQSLKLLLLTLAFMLGLPAAPVLIVQVAPTPVEEHQEEAGGHRHETRPMTAADSRGGDGSSRRHVPLLVGAVPGTHRPDPRFDAHAHVDGSCPGLKTTRLRC